MAGEPLARRRSACSLISDLIFQQNQINATSVVLFLTQEPAKLYIFKTLYPKSTLFYIQLNVLLSPFLHQFHHTEQVWRQTSLMGCYFFFAGYHVAVCVKGPNVKGLEPCLAPRCKTSVASPLRTPRL